MNKVLMSLLFTAFILTGARYAQTQPPAADAPAAPAATAPETPKPAMHHHDRFPELHRASRKLRGARQDLEKAAHDYDGHKAKAISAIDEALSEIKAAEATK